MSRNFLHSKIGIFALALVLVSSLRAQSLSSEDRFEYFSQEREFPNYFIPWENRSDPESMSEEKEDEIIAAVENAAASILNRLSIPVVVGEPPELQNLALFPHLRNRMADSEVEIIPSHGVVRMVINYLYSQLRLRALRDSDVDAVEFLNALATETSPISAFEVRGLGSDLDVHVRGGDTEARRQAMKAIQDVIESAHRHYEATQLRVDLQRTLFTIADPIHHDSHIERTTSQGGSNLDWISFQLEDGGGRFLLPDEHPDIIRNLIIHGSYNYLPPAEGVHHADLDKQTIRGIRGLIEFPFSHIEDEVRLRSELEDIINRLKNDQPVSPKINRFFERIARNARYEGAHNRLYRGDAGSIEALIQELMQLYEEKVHKAVVPEYLDRFEGPKPNIPSDLSEIFTDETSFRDQYTDQGFLFHVVPDIALSPAILRQGFFVSRDGAPLPGDRTSTAVYDRGTYFFRDHNSARDRSSGKDHAIIFKVPIATHAHSRILNLDLHAAHPEVLRIQEEARVLGRDFHEHLGRTYGVDFIIRNNYILAQNAAALGEVNLVDLINGYGRSSTDSTLDLQSRLYARTYHSRLVAFAKALGLSGLEAPLSIRSLALEALQTENPDLSLISNHALKWLQAGDITREEFNRSIEINVLPLIEAGKLTWGLEQLLAEYMSAEPEAFEKIESILIRNPKAVEAVFQFISMVKVTAKNRIQIQRIIDNPAIELKRRIYLYDLKMIGGQESFKSDVLISHITDDPVVIEDLLSLLPSLWRERFEADRSNTFEIVLDAIKSRLSDPESNLTKAQRQDLELKIWATLYIHASRLRFQELRETLEPNLTETDINDILLTSNDQHLKANALAYAIHQGWDVEIKASDFVQILLNSASLPIESWRFNSYLNLHAKEKLLDYQLSEDDRTATRQLFSTYYETPGDQDTFEYGITLYSQLVRTREDLDLLLEFYDPSSRRPHPFLEFLDRRRSTRLQSYEPQQLGDELKLYIQSTLEELMESGAEHTKQVVYYALIGHFPDSVVAQRELVKRLSEGKEGALQESKQVLNHAKETLPELRDNITKVFLSAETDEEKEKALKLLADRNDLNIEDKELLSKILEFGLQLAAIDHGENSKKAEGDLASLRRLPARDLLKRAKMLSPEDESTLISLLDDERRELRQFAEDILLENISQKGLMELWRRLKEGEDFSFPQSVASFLIQATPADVLNIPIVNQAIDAVPGNDFEAVEKLFSALLKAHSRLGQSPVAAEIERRVNSVAFYFLEHPNDENYHALNRVTDAYFFQTTPTLVETLELLARTTHEPNPERFGMEMDIVYQILKSLGKPRTIDSDGLKPKASEEVRQAAAALLNTLPRSAGCASAIQMLASERFMKNLIDANWPDEDDGEEL